jgi:hypothetical protein
VIDMESKYGIPTVGIHVHVFARLVDSTVRTNGMPRARQAFVRAPMFNQPPAVLRGYIEGDDAVHGGPFMERVFGLLTRPLADEDLRGSGWDRSTPRLLEPDTEENLHELFRQNHWTDYLPIMLPTEERVEAMLAGTSRSPDEVVGKHRPTVGMEVWESTVEKVAVNAVIAGAAPEHFPVILALCASGDTGRQSSMSSMGNMVVVNGPIRNEIGMNSGIGAMGPYNHANATIGRAYGLLSQNLQGGSVPNETYMGSQGNPLSYSFCFPENEEASPWEPFHVSHGFKPEESTVSLFLGGWYTIFGNGPRDTWQERFKHAFEACDTFLGPIVALDPLVARGFVARGFDTKQKLIDWFAENCRLPAREYWDSIWMQTLAKPWGIAGIEPFASRLQAPPDEEVEIFRPEDISIVVVGGETQPTWKLIAGSLRDNIVSVDAWR